MPSDSFCKVRIILILQERKTTNSFPAYIYETILNKILAYQTQQCTGNYLSQPDGHPSQVGRADLTLKKLNDIIH